MVPACQSGQLEQTALEVTLQAPSLSDVVEVELTLSTPLGRRPETRTYPANGSVDGETLVATLPAWVEGRIDVMVAARTRAGESWEGTSDVSIVPLTLNRTTVRLGPAGDGGPDGEDAAGDAPVDLPDGIDGDVPGDVPPDGDPINCLYCSEFVNDGQDYSQTERLCAQNGPPSSLEIFEALLGCVCDACGDFCTFACDPDGGKLTEECGGCVEKSCQKLIATCSADVPPYDCQACGDPRCEGRLCGPEPPGGGDPSGTCCSGSCVDLERDPANCGICGRACNPGDACMNGACMAPLPPPAVILTPLSTSFGIGNVTIRWQAFETDLILEACRDRLCLSPFYQVGIDGTNATDIPLDDAGTPVVFFRIVSNRTGAATSTRVIYVRPRVFSTTRDGASWGTLFDFNADGHPDLAVSEPGVPRVVLYRGSPGGLLDAGELRSRRPGFGRAITNGGDIDGDSFADLVVADDSNITVFFGGPAGIDPTARQPQQIARLHPGEITLAGLGDFDGNGHADVAVGYPDARTVTIHLGRPDGLSPIPDVMETSVTMAFGRALAGIGDVNGDGRAELAVGNEAAQSVTIVTAGVAAPVATITLPGPPNIGGFGRMVASAGDLDGNGYPDLLVAANSTVFFFPGGPNGLERTPTATFSEPNSRDLGAAMAPVGDLNRDGIDDVALAAPDERVVFFYYGSQPPNASSAFMHQPSGSAEYGRVLVSIGDVERDGDSNYGIRYCQANAGCGLEIHSGPADSRPPLQSGGSFGQSVAGRSGG